MSKSHRYQGQRSNYYQILKKRYMKFVVCHFSPFMINIVNSPHIMYRAPKHNQTISSELVMVVSIRMLQIGK